MTKPAPTTSATSKRKSIFNFFRIVAIVEGITTLLLFFIAMPMKYLFDIPKAVTVVGTIHGYAFVAYIVAMVVALWGRNWTPIEWARTTFASFFPFGTFLNDPFLKRKQLAD